MKKTKYILHLLLLWILHDIIKTYGVVANIMNQGNIFSS